ncbi:MAG TPA: SgcJ/EcaC family oxidoreductase [Actinospica sp.]|nr:SgcJ/EcaC family oxidoreductase [Actinospica sp.]
MTEKQYDGEAAAVLEVLAGVYKAWEANDADAFVEHYTEDAVAILPGSYRGSRKAVRDGMAAGFAGPLKGSSTVDKVVDVRLYGADTALVTSETGVLLAGESEVPASQMTLATWALTKREGQWLVASYHNSPRDPAAR